MGYIVCGECHSLGQHQQGDIITIGLHTPECHQNPKYYNPLQSESEKFFAAVNDGRVSLVNFGHWRNGSADENDEWIDEGLRVVITPKEVGE